MSTKFKSPYAKPFITGCKNGTPCTTVVNSIAKRTGKPVSTIWNSLCKCGVCCCVKFNGTCVYWPNFPVKKNPSVSKTCQTNMWQCFIDWCISSGCCTPNQLNRNCSSQKTFMTFCRSFFGKQFTPMTKSTPKTKRSPKRRIMRKPTRTTKAWAKSPITRGKKRPMPKRGRKTTPKTWSWSRTAPRTYKFPTWRTSTNTRRYRYAA